ncbi:HxlR family transcriptional regulator, partial [Streptomyces sp. SID7499]|nr:HxlR family transcriptional regulator [Streptomyces sp. SID7499]
ERTIREVLYPITDIGASVHEALEAVRRPAE